MWSGTSWARRGPGSRRRGSRRATIPTGGARRTTIERRHQYRVSASLEAIISASLVVDGASAIDAVLIDISAGGAGVSVGEKDLAAVKKARKLDLKVWSPRLEAPLVLPAEVRGHALKDGIAKVGLSFSEWAPTRDELDPSFRTMFNLRETFRVPVPMTLGVAADLSQGDITVRTVLRDASMNGLGLDSDARVLDVFEDGSRVVLAFQMPNATRRDEAEVTIRHRDHFVGAKRIYVGVQLPPERAIPTGLRLSLQRLVMELQRRK